MAILVALSGAVVLAAQGCSRVHVSFDAGQGGDGGDGGDGGSAGGIGGTGGGGTGGDAAGTGGGAGTVIGGNGGGGTGGGSAGTGGVAGNGGGAGAGGRGGSAGGSTGGSSAGTSGGGTGGGVAGAGGRGGTGGTAGAGGTAGGTAGTGGSAGAAGRGGTGGTAGTAGTTGGTGGGTGGTGGGTAGVGVTPTVAGQIVISEVMHNTAGIGNEFGEWFEVYNPSATVTYDLRTCQIDDISTGGSSPVTISASVLVPPGQFRALAISSSPGFVPAYVYGSVRFDNDAAEQVNVSCGGTLIDRFAYGDFDATDPLGTGKTFQVDPDFLTATGNDVRANWCYGSTVYLTTAGTINEYGTPGMPNVQCP